MDVVHGFIRLALSRRGGVDSGLLRLRGTSSSIDPCIPRSWPRYSVGFRYHSIQSQIEVENPSGVLRGIAQVAMDGKPVPNLPSLPLVDDGANHPVRVALGCAETVDQTPQFGLSIQLLPTRAATFQVCHIRNHFAPLVRRSVVRLDDVGT